jgi:hypothetical protein
MRENFKKNLAQLFFWGVAFGVMLGVAVACEWVIYIFR